MLDRIRILGELAFVLLFVFGFAFTIIDERMQRRISIKLQKQIWPTVVMYIWAALALTGIGIAIFKGCLF